MALAFFACGNWENLQTLQMIPPQAYFARILLGAIPGPLLSTTPLTLYRAIHSEAQIT